MILRLLAIILIPFLLSAQSQRPSLLDNLEYESIGPTVFSGRITDIAVDPSDATHFYVSYASGGLWETVNNGTTFTPIFDHEAVITIGAIAVNWSSNEIWVGTGEVNSSRSSYAGLGIYKSSDNGMSWTEMGLQDSHHIGRIILHPTDTKTAWVAVLGHLYTDNAERGVYKTTNGGQSWQHTLSIDEGTGVVDLIIDPNDPDILYGAAWQRSRKAWNFVEAGKGSGIYKSKDGGVTWGKMSGGTSGFPDGEGTGRIGLSISAVEDKTRIYALLDNYNRRPKEDKTDDALVKDDFKSMSKDALLALEDDQLKTYLKDNRFPKKYSSEEVKKLVKANDISPIDLATYLESANSLLFDTPVVGAELYSSDDGGNNWTKTHDGFMDGVYYSYGYYFGTIGSSNSSLDNVYIAGVPILRSSDGGQTFESINADNVHVDHHVIWINPDNPKHIINGNDGGINISYDDGDNWIKCNAPSVGQFYYINVDAATPYNVYGGVQDNGVWKGSHKYREGVRWHNTGRYPYQSIIGGDGMQVQIDPRDNETVYTGYQFGNYFRINTTTGTRIRITPMHELGEDPYRWNWQSPIHLSTHHPDILYMGGHKLFRSFDQGDSFDAISDDLTQGGKKGDVAYGTLTSIHESPMRFGLIYTGSDDGLIHVSKDGGHSWSNISTTLPQQDHNRNLWVSRVQASSHKESRVFAALNGYRNDDFTPYVYVSDDYGQNWKQIGTELPMASVNVIKEDPNHQEILYVGTDNSVYISIDHGAHFMKTSANIPNVPVHDIVVHADAKDLLIGTHGRSIYRTDLEMIYKLAKESMSPLLITDIPSIRYNKNLGNRNSFYREYSKNEQKFIVFSNSTGPADLLINKEGENDQIYSRKISLIKGLNSQVYDLSLDERNLNKYKKSFAEEPMLKKAKDGKFYLVSGKYILTIRKGKDMTSTTFEIKDKL